MARTVKWTKRIATEWCATGISRPYSPKLGSMCFFKKSEALKYIRIMKRRYPDEAHFLESRRVFRPIGPRGQRYDYFIDPLKIQRR